MLSGNLEVIIDTSSILFSFEYRKDVFGIVEAEFPHATMSISRGVLRELAAAALNKGRKGAAARTALLAVKSKKLKVYNNNGHVDAWIVGMARASGGKVAIVTNDTLLVKRLHSFQGLRISKLSNDGRLRY